MRNKLKEENPRSLVVKISDSITSMMEKKEKAVKVGTKEVPCLISLNITITPFHCSTL